MKDKVGISTKTQMQKNCNKAVLFTIREVIKTVFNTVLNSADWDKSLGGGTHLHLHIIVNQSGT